MTIKVDAILGAIRERDETLIRSLPASHGDIGETGVYFFDWNTLGLNTATILQVVEVGAVSGAQAAWGNDGLTVAGIANADQCRLIYLVPTRFDLVGGIDPLAVDDVPVSVAGLNDGWQFAKPADTYANCVLPHSINADDSATANYYRGVVNYARTINMSSGKRYYLCLDGANQRGTISLNGVEVGAAVNAYQPVVIDLTDAGASNGANEIQVSLTNASDSSAIPYAADFNFYNGLDRGVRLIESGRLCFDPVFYGTRRCKITADAETRRIAAKVKALNHNPTIEVCDIEATVYRANEANAIVSVTESAQSIPANGGVEFALQLDIPSGDFALWDGRNGAILYRVEFKIKQNGAVKDTVIEKTGFRTFFVAKHTTAADGAGFQLNGLPYRLYGTNYHTDRMGRASALKAGDYAADLAMMEALRPTMLKFAHSPCDHSLLDFCDEHGIIVMLEIPWSRNFPPATSSIAEAYRENIASAMLGMVKEYGNHPSIVFWCFDNELGMEVTLGYDTAELRVFMASLYAEVKAIDPQRLIGAGFYVNTSGERGWTDVCDVMLSTHYAGWYSGTVGNSLSQANSDNSQMAMPKAINEYGYGANPLQHVAWSDAANSKPSAPNDYNNPHYEEYQAWALEQYLKQFKDVQWPVFNLQWAMFDFGVASRAEGGTRAINTKGLITRDRATLKDSYYLYKALWNPAPMVHICQKRWSDRGNAAEAALHVYANGAKVELYHNGTLVQSLSAPNGALNVCWDFNAVVFIEGENTFEVRVYAAASDSAALASDSWMYTKAASDIPEVTVSGDDVIVNSGKLYAEVAPAEAPQSVTWTSGDENAATIDASGNVVVLGDGDVTFTATGDLALGTKLVKCRKVSASNEAFRALLASKSTATGLGAGSLGEKQGVTVTANGDGTVTLNGTATAKGPHVVFPFWRPVSPFIGGCFPYARQEGELLVWAEYVSGSVTGWSQTGDNYWRIGLADDLGNDIPESYIAPIGSPENWNLGGRPVMARRMTGEAGIGAIRFVVNFKEGAVFDNLTYRICTAKIPSGAFFDTGLMTNVPAANSAYVTNDGRAMAARNIDGSFVVQPFTPNTVYLLTGSKSGFVRLWDSFDIGPKHATGSRNIATAGTTVKLSVDLLRIPNITTINADSELRWILRGADGTVVAALDYVTKGTGQISSVFDANHAEITAVAATGVLGVELLIGDIAFAAHANNYDNTKHIRFAVKVESV